MAAIFRNRKITPLAVIENEMQHIIGQHYVDNGVHVPQPVQYAPNIKPTVGRYSGVGEKLLFGGPDALKYKFVSPKVIFHLLHDIKEKRDHRKKLVPKPVKVVSSLAGDVAGMLVGEASRKVSN